ncbi:glutathione S-transferase family protein [Bradyrhizobium sp. HKCCYLS20291]|uniref:glutathione S-transferase family protein n=1 Tax=Bradyrhizobium sp. HKCCYLS20291 TaxID=3420766 RepID=UPI003EBF8DED
MRILTNSTSPYARIARIALAEKGFDLGGTEIVNPWADDASLLKLNPASRVPTLELDSGIPLTESLLIVTWLERKVASPSLLDGDLDRIISRAGAAMGVIDAMVHIMIGVLQMDPNWGETKVGLKRRRTIVTGLRALEADPPVYGGGTPDISVITTVVAVDYIRLRFPDAPWREPTPKLDALRDAVAARPAFATTLPYV